MRIAFNRRIIDGPYGGGNQVLRQLVACCRNQGAEPVFGLDGDANVVVLFDVRDTSTCIPLADIVRLKRERPEVKIIHR